MQVHSFLLKRGFVIISCYRMELCCYKIKPEPPVLQHPRALYKLRGYLHTVGMTSGFRVLLKEASSA